MADKGLLLVLSGPSGVGKGTVKSAIVEHKVFPFEYSVSMTTRKPREGEVNGKDYYFVTREEFKQAIADSQLLEYNEYVGNLYGTPLGPVKEMLAAGKDVLLEIDVNGARMVRQQMPDGVFIFLTPPDLHTLRDRLEHRGTESEDVIRGRIAQARKEILVMQDYDYAVVNDTVANAVNHIKAIVDAEHVSVKRMIDDYRKMVKED
ncbi:guanylate kinase [Lactobacillus delbrueckii]|uniref:Guanylate kinase n=1 Tax=Lactobacillus delbrueckii TaxID=1584 RepID=A0AAW5YXY6_9LACO|nr:guanylate kinase [Lactobacillus delbrueckii]TXG09476.1 guanylate kinase [Lactobacillus delbrueckii subsp. bulgaricus]APP02884.1 guanylate kinase [Lactobacillus delbrueckii subsp. indicus]KNE30433.1 guanylate kinase [Lactobacillus delbrueckii subsp. indicus]MCT2877963.1 guanylate kinase [Lactobacillus delbrueckii]MCT3491649.1 guanylate kinase [Lactobacillus delbrueckii]